MKKVRRLVDIATGQAGDVLAERRVRSRLKRVPPEQMPSECVLYFAGDPIDAYQVRQWYEPMQKLAQVHPIAVMVRRPLTAQVLNDCPLPMVLATNMPEQEAFLSAHPVKIIFYVNNNKENFLTLRYTGPIHIHLSHGESDKTSMASNQLKAYDYAFIAGDASRSRIERIVKRLDPWHLVEIGRPQLDAPEYEEQVPDDGRTVVLYAPTWEGERPAMAYGSVGSHGTAMISALLSDPSIRVIYRPHPRVGVREAAESKASKVIKGLIRSANEADNSADHVIDDSADFRWSISNADVGIVDISAMAADWLATGKPMLVTKPADSRAYVDPDGLAGALELLPQQEAADIASHVFRLHQDGPSAAQLAQIKHHFGTVAPGDATVRFLNAVDRVLTESG